MNRVFIIVLDSLGVGYLPDAEEYGDLGANTLGHIDDSLELKLPVLESCGLGNILPLRGVSAVDNPRASWGRAASVTKGKDSTVGHWEIAGLPIDEALMVWPEGIPAEITAEFESRINLKTLGGSVASGTQIIAELGSEHCRTGYPIIYTSADSVFQIAAHEEIVPLETLYSWCEAAREMLNVGRVIARPFIGTEGSWKRTGNRHDYSMPAPGITMLDVLARAGKSVTSVGKISDLFAGRGINESFPTKTNDEGMQKTIELAGSDSSGLVFVNLIEFDSVYGHRRDVRGYRDALQAFDAQLGTLLPLLGEDDAVIICADHGCDPIFKGTDHSREYIPVLVYGPALKAVELGTRSSFADIAATTLDLLLGNPADSEIRGQSFAKEMNYVYTSGNNQKET
ncbi:phosphopentomutase [Spirochaeta dissipatitropha]